jgi:hypothetical protein
MVSEVAARINGSSVAVLAPISPAPLVEPAKRRRPVGLLAAAVVLAIAGGLGAVWAVNQSGERTDVVWVARQVDWGEVVTAPGPDGRAGGPGRQSAAGGVGGSVDADREAGGDHVAAGRFGHR